MKRVVKLVLLASLIGCLVVGLLLLTGHAGFAIKLANYLFFIIALGIVLNYTSDE